MAATTVYQDPYADAVREAADDVIRQLEDGAPCQRMRTLAAAGYHFEDVRVYFADVTASPARGLPAGVARVSLDVSPTRGRQPAHEVRVFLQPVPMPIAARPCAKFADDIAAAVLDMIDPTADYAR